MKTLWKEESKEISEISGVNNVNLRPKGYYSDSEKSNEDNESKHSSDDAIDDDIEGGFKFKINKNIEFFNGTLCLNNADWIFIILVCVLCLVEIFRMETLKKDHWDETSLRQRIWKAYLTYNILCLCMTVIYGFICYIWVRNHYILHCISIPLLVFPFILFCIIAFFKNKIYENYDFNKISNSDVVACVVLGNNLICWMIWTNAGIILPKLRNNMHPILK